MNSARKMKLRLAAAKPRNPLVAQAAQREAGSHRKSKSAQRQQDKLALRKELNRPD